MSNGTPSREEIFIVDDDVGVRESLSMVFSLQGYEVLGLSDGASLLAAAQQRVPACIILDVNMPGRSGLDILKELNADAYGAPILIISGQGDIAMAVDAIKNGALDFIEKPFDVQSVLGRVREAIDAWRRRREGMSTSSVRAARFPGRELLTQREVDVLDQIASGYSSKEAGRQLGISFRTVEVHRSRIMEKLGAKNAVDLARIVFSEGRGH